MKRITAILAMFLLLNNAFAQPPKLYINIVTHNEPGDNLHQAFNFNKSAVLVQELADIVVSKGAAWNLETCDGFVNGALTIQGYTSNVLKTLAGTSYNDHIEIDPRNKNFTNIADLYHLLDSCGANPTTTLGGFIYYSNTTTLPDWFQYQDTIFGITYPDSKWKCNLIWGAGSLQPHTNDLNDYGIWKPDTTDNFYSHNPERSLWYIGNGCQPLYSLDSLDDEQIIIDLIKGTVDSIQNGLWPQNKFYNYSITANQSQFGPMLFQKLATLIDSVNAIGINKVEWLTLTKKFDAFEVWQNTPEEYSQWNCGDLYESISDDNKDEEMNVFPNPFSDLFTIELPDNDNHEVRIYNTLGKQVYASQLTNKTQINTAILPHGFYIVTIDNSLFRKITKQ